MSKRIVTISREFGSGGRTVGRMVAEQLGYKFYDRELIQLVANQSGFALEFVEETDEYSTTSSLLYNLSMGGTYAQAGFSPDHLPPVDKIQILQNNIIRELAEKDPCVIVGRSADYILRDRTDCLNTPTGRFGCAARLRSTVSPKRTSKSWSQRGTRRAHRSTGTTPTGSGAWRTTTI